MNIGFSQPIELPWLEYTALLVASGQEPEHIRSSLTEMLGLKIPAENQAAHGSRYKRVSILMRTWVLVPGETQAFRESALGLLKLLPSSERLPVHYGMTIVAYPFFARVAEHIGRLLRLQETFSVQQLQRRVCESLGQRDTVRYAVARVVRSLMDWGCLKQETKSGSYAAMPQIRIQEQDLACWLLEAILLSLNQNSMALDQVESTPVLFPFTLDSVREALRHPKRRLSITRHGLDAERLERKA